MVARGAAQTLILGAASQGLAQSTYNSALMFALILLILVVVLLIFGIAGRLEKHLLRWD